MKTTRSTNGSGLTKSVSSSRARDESEMRTSSNGILLMPSQKIVPESIAVILVSRPPWLWPIDDHVVQAVVAARRDRSWRPRRAARGAAAWPNRRSDCRCRSGRTRTGSAMRMRGSLSRSLTMSAQRAGLELVPCTNTTGIRPGRYGSVATKRAVVWTPIALPRNADSSCVQNCAPASVIATLAVRSISNGMTVPLISRLVVVGRGVEIEASLQRRLEDLLARMLEAQHQPSSAPVSDRRRACPPPCLHRVIRSWPPGSPQCRAVGSDCADRRSRTRTPAISSTKVRELQASSSRSKSSVDRAERELVGAGAQLHGIGPGRRETPA